MSNRAVIVIDMLSDFVTGSLKCERAGRVIPNVKKLIAASREKSVPVIYCNDAHFPNVDAEFAVWGSHAVKGTEGAEVIDALKPTKQDFVIDKRRYSCFFETGLDILLRELDVDTVILTGLHTNCCIKHTAADATFRLYKIEIPEDCVDAFTEEEHKFGLDYMEKFYKVKITTTDKIINELEQATA